MYTHNAKISIRQVKLLLTLQMFNMSVLILPRVTAKLTGHDGYFVPLLALVAGLVYVTVISKLLARFPGEGLDGISTQVVGKALGYIIVLLYVLKLIISAGLEVRLFAEMIAQVLLPKTPLAVIILLLLATVYYLIKSGLEATGRMAEILAYFVFIPLVFVLIVIAVRADYGQLLPLFQAKATSFGLGGYYVSMTFMPLEFMLMIGALTAKPNRVKEACTFSVVFISILEVVIIALSYAGVGMDECARQIWPVLTLMQSVQLPGSFLENQEILMMAWWVMSVYMYVSGGIYVASLTLSRLAKFNRQNVTVIPILPLVYVVALLPTGLGESYAYLTKFSGLVGGVFLLIIPLFLLVVAKLRKVGGKHVHDEKI